MITVPNMMELTTLKRTPKRVRLVNDIGEMVAEWPLNLAPESHAEACRQAIEMALRAGVIR